MDLLIQLQSLLFSFLFGILFNLVLNSFDLFIYHEKLVIKILSAFLISIFLSVIYFVISMKINQGIIHIYFIGMIIFGYFIDYRYICLHKRIKKIVNKCKNNNI